MSQNLFQNEHLGIEKFFIANFFQDLAIFVQNGEKMANSKNFGRNFFWLESILLEIRKRQLRKKYHNFP